MTEDEIVKSIKASCEPVEGWCHHEKMDVLARLILREQPRAVLELGVHGGRSLCVLGLALQATGQGFVLGVDSWKPADNVEGVDPEEQPGHFNNWVNADLEKFYRMAAGWIAQLGIGDHCGLLRAGSAAAAQLFADGGLDLVHLDASKARLTSLRDCQLWIPKVKIGGTVIFDDIDWDTSRMAQIWARRHCRELLEVEIGQRDTPTFKGAFAVWQREK